MHIIQTFLDLLEGIDLLDLGSILPCCCMTSHRASGVPVVVMQLLGPTVLQTNVAESTEIED